MVGEQKEMKLNTSYDVFEDQTMSVVADTLNYDLDTYWAVDEDTGICYQLFIDTKDDRDIEQVILEDYLS
jgi:hypothetical protein